MKSKIHMQCNIKQEKNRMNNKITKNAIKKNRKSITFIVRRRIVSKEPVSKHA